MRDFESVIEDPAAWLKAQREALVFKLIFGELRAGADKADPG